MIVAPERLTPGIIDRHWTKPIPSAVFQFMASTLSVATVFVMRSIARMARPPRISAQATIAGVSSITLIAL